MKLLASAILAAGLSVTIPVYAVDNYTLDPNHSYALWSVNHFGFSTITGKFMAEGTLQLDEKKLQNSKVNVTVQISDVITGIPKFNTHLLSKDFFNAPEFSTATFISDKVDLTGPKTANVHGLLTIHGVSKPVMFKVMLNNKGVHPYTRKITVGFSGDTVIKRSEFNMGLYVPNVSDEVKIHIETEAEKSI